MRRWLFVFDCNFPYPVLIGWLADSLENDSAIRDLRNIEDWWRKGPFFVIIEDVAANLPFPIFFVNKNGALVVIREYEDVLDFDCEITGIARGE